MRMIRNLLVCMVLGLVSLPVGAISEEQKAGISDHCDTIVENLKKVQHSDARARVYLGGYYETILTKFVMPLNLRIVENNLSAPELIENQSKMAEAKATFADDYVHYQQELEGLVGMDCKKEPEAFYERLELVRKGRKKVERDVAKMRNLITEQVKLVKELKDRI